MKINVELSDGVLNSAIEKGLEKYLSSKDGEKFLQIAIDKKVNSFVTERKLIGFVQDRISRIITQESLAGISNAFGLEDYENRMVQIFTKMVSKSSEFKDSVRDAVRSMIKV